MTLPDASRIALVAREVGRAEHVDLALVRHALAQDGIVGCALRELGPDRASAVGLRHVGGDPGIAQEDGRAATDDRAHAIDSGIGGVDGVGAHVQAITLDAEGRAPAYVGETLLEQAQVAGETVLGARLQSGAHLHEQQTGEDRRREDEQHRAEQADARGQRECRQSRNAGARRRSGAVEVHGRVPYSGAYTAHPLRSDQRRNLNSP
ncbi:hypothetical protein GOFOIKOB_5233 [Methylobacterium tardum]|uniref:Uncharacterized protein n=1 Tax=Methylobacterium tardum TaxID=374432 RepID=A0AA37THD3_9HYPH|nr:hypothetical protein GOFOIKOB_5233 [Methylobacterium tardum]GLS71730.1 hypothetical protein GCM10007890_37430 [Methylobacterium tardum]